MAISLNDSPAHPTAVFTRIVNCVRIRNVPAINLGIMAILGFFLVKLTFKYTGLYMKNSLITIIVTNLVLYGISETLAQTILVYRPRAPGISLRFREYLLLLGVDDEAEPHGYRDDVESTDIERFIDFVQQEDTEDGISMRPYEVEPVQTTPDYPLTYFQFERLAGFMVWGLVMAFAQCWWYKFLQIYAKDPKFIEVLRKVLTDQLCYLPISLFCFFTYGTIVLENKSWEDTKAKLSKIYLKTLMINYSVWFPVQFFNFLIVPRSLQVPFSSSISVLWNCFLSMRNSAA